MAPWDLILPLFHLPLAEKQLLGFTMLKQYIYNVIYIYSNHYIIILHIIAQTNLDAKLELL